MTTTFQSLSFAPFESPFEMEITEAALVLNELPEHLQKVENSLTVAERRKNRNRVVKYYEFLVKLTNRVSLFGHAEGPKPFLAAGQLTTRFNLNADIISGICHRLSAFPRNEVTRCVLEAQRNPKYIYEIIRTPDFDFTTGLNNTFKRFGKLCFNTSSSDDLLKYCKKIVGHLPEDWNFIYQIEAPRPLSPTPSRPILRVVEMQEKLFVFVEEVKAVAMKLNPRSPLFKKNVSSGKPQNKFERSHVQHYFPFEYLNFALQIFGDFSQDDLELVLEKWYTNATDWFIPAVGPSCSNVLPTTSAFFRMVLMYQETSEKDLKEDILLCFKTYLTRGELLPNVSIYNPFGTHGVRGISDFNVAEAVKYYPGVKKTVRVNKKNTKPEPKKPRKNLNIPIEALRKIPPRVQVNAIRIMQIDWHYAQVLHENGFCDPNVFCYAEIFRSHSPIGPCVFSDEQWKNRIQFYMTKDYHEEVKRCDFIEKYKDEFTLVELQPHEIPCDDETPPPKSPKTESEENTEEEEKKEETEEEKKENLLEEIKEEIRENLNNIEMMMKDEMKELKEKKKKEEKKKEKKKGKIKEEKADSGKGDSCGKPSTSSSFESLQEVSEKPAETPTKQGSLDDIELRSSEEEEPKKEENVSGWLKGEHLKGEIEKDCAFLTKELSKVERDLNMYKVESEEQKIVIDEFKKRIEMKKVRGEEDRKTIETQKAEISRLKKKLEKTEKEKKEEVDKVKGDCKRLEAEKRKIEDEILSSNTRKLMENSESMNQELKKSEAKWKLKSSNDDQLIKEKQKTIENLRKLLSEKENEMEEIKNNSNVPNCQLNEIENQTCSIQRQMSSFVETNGKSNAKMFGVLTDIKRQEVQNTQAIQDIQTAQNVLQTTVEQNFSIVSTLERQLEEEKMCNDTYKRTSDAATRAAVVRLRRLMELLFECRKDELRFGVNADALIEEYANLEYHKNSHYVENAIIYLQNARMERNLYEMRLVQMIEQIKRDPHKYFFFENVHVDPTYPEPFSPSTWARIEQLRDRKRNPEYICARRYQPNA